ncbi:MAG: hypothetical protein IT440_15120 [Phycisphaeraceae bacterium]|nr:hypothetical protein [Phycisphaeraceae bacterium]
MMLKLATILDNPGEPSAQTRYRDAAQLRRLGYTGLVLYETTALSGVDSPDAVGTGEMKRWVAQQFDRVRQRVEESHAAGLQVFISYDALSLAANTVSERPSQYVCRNRPGVLCPASDAVLDRSAASLKNLLSLLPPVDGVVLRFGDNDAARLPFLEGNDIYLPHCPRCSQLGRADRIIRVLERFHAVVVGQLNKTLIARAWNVRPNGMHDSVELCQRLRPRLPGREDDPRFILSFKFTQTDFWRYQKWNPSSLTFGQRPILYELQCQREFEAKGGVPNWQVPLWRDGMPEMRDQEEVRGLADVAGKVNLAGLWAWVRGGGWGGPFIRDETWIDANAWAVPLLADNPAASPGDLADQWIAERLGVDDKSLAKAMRQVLEESPSVALKGFYIGPFARTKNDPWHPNADWIQDDVLDAEAAWRMIQKLPDGAMTEVVEEKQWAAQKIAEHRALLQHQIRSSNRTFLEPLVNTLTYGESLIAAIRDLLAGMAAHRRCERARTQPDHDSVTPTTPTAGSDAELAKQRLLAAQSHWNHHVQRHGSLHGAASAFREVNLWDVTERMLRGR